MGLVAKGIFLSTSCDVPVSLEQKNSPYCRLESPLSNKQLGVESLRLRDVKDNFLVQFKKIKGDQETKAFKPSIYRSN